MPTNPLPATLRADATLPLIRSQFELASKNQFVNVSCRAKNTYWTSRKQYLSVSRRPNPKVQEGFAASLTEAATRFAISHPAIGTILVGIAVPHQFENAPAAAEKGPLPPAALDRLSTL